MADKSESVGCVYKDPNAAVEDRVKDLLSRMTLKEKIGQMIQIDRAVATPSVITDYLLGNFLFSSTL